MEAAFNIFLNGIFGVFIGLAVLYAAIKISSLVNGPKAAADKEE